MHQSFTYLERVASAVAFHKKLETGDDRTPEKSTKYVPVVRIRKLIFTFVLLHSGFRTINDSNFYLIWF